MSVAIETPVLMLGLARVHPMRRRIGAGLWLTACSYPLVALVLPGLMAGHRTTYVITSEAIAGIGECALFAAAFHEAGQPRTLRWRDHATIIAANALSFGLGCLVRW